MKHASGHAWDMAEDNILISMWPLGLQKAVTALEELNKDTYRHRSDRACKSRVNVLRKRGVKIEPPPRPKTSDRTLAKWQIRARDVKKLEYSKPEFDNPIEYVPRKCSRCRTEFNAPGRFIRICVECKQTATWKSYGLIPHGSTGRRL